MSAIRALLEVSDVMAGYDESQVLFGVSFHVAASEIVSLLGRNGMGKTTTVSAVMGILTPRAGEIWFEGRAIHGWPAYRVARCGLGLVPEGRQIFSNLTVRENLVAIAANRANSGDPWTLADVLELFPPLALRLHSPGGLLSGGEQQMLAIGRALMTNPKLLILDEATEGLAPLVRSEIWRVLAQLKACGQSLLIVDKNIAELSRIVDRHYILEKGRVVWSGSSTGLNADSSLSQRYLGV